MAALTVATLNLRGRHDRWSDRRHLMVAQLLDIQPDLLSLQEISVPIGQGKWLRNQLNARLAAEGQRPYALIQRHKAHWLYGRQEAIGILTRLPVRYHDSIDLGYGGCVALRANIELPDRHALDFVATHLHHVARDIEAREEQVMKLMGWLATSRHVPLQVVAGDFNEVPQGLATRRMRQGFRSAYADRHGYEPLATFPTMLRGVHDWSGCLDYIFLSPSVGKVTAANIFMDKPAVDDDTLYPSDHVGLIATIEMAD